MEKSKKIVFLEKMLGFLARKIINRHQPKVIAITGSVGKTGTKDMVWHLLKDYYSARRNVKNYNNEIGLPLTIIGVESGKGSALGWLRALLKGLWVAFFSRSYPDILVLEMGADRKGDLKYLCQLAPPNVGVVTNVGNSHLEYFKTRAGLAREKSTVLKAVTSGGLAIINLDDREMSKLSGKLREKEISIGVSSEEAQMRATDIKFGKRVLVTKNNSQLKVVDSLIFKLNYQGKIIPVKLRYALGVPSVYSAMIALAVGEYFQINIVDAAQILSDFLLPKGRLRLIKGIKHTVVIDDTYNSAPNSLQEALTVLGQCEANRKVAVLGDMLELGKEEAESHRKVVTQLVTAGVSHFLAVGKRMKLAYQACVNKTGIRAAYFDSPEEAGLALQRLLQEGDIALVKGSQGMRMEKVVEKVMAEPEKKEKLLVRQDSDWQAKPFVQP